MYLKKVFWDGLEHIPGIFRDILGRVSGVSFEFFGRFIKTNLQNGPQPLQLFNLEVDIKELNNISLTFI